MDEFWVEISAHFGEMVLDWDAQRLDELEGELAAHLQLQDGQPGFWVEMERKTFAYFRAISFDEEAVRAEAPLFKFMPIPCYRDVVRDLSEGLNMDIPPWSRTDRRWLSDGILPPYGKACYLRGSLQAYLVAIAAYNHRSLLTPQDISSRIGLQILLRGLLHETSGLDFYKLSPDISL